MPINYSTVALLARIEEEEEACIMHGAKHGGTAAAAAHQNQNQNQRSDWNEPVCSGHFYNLHMHGGVSLPNQARQVCTGYHHTDSILARCRAGGDASRHRTRPEIAPRDGP